MKSNATIVVLLASITLATGLQMPPGAPAQAAADERILAAEDIAEVTLEVGGITCDSCAYMVHTALSDAPGVRGVELYGTDDPTVVRAVVTCDPDTASADALAATTSDLGYPTTVIADDQS